MGPNNNQGLAEACRQISFSQKFILKDANICLHTATKTMCNLMFIKKRQDIHDYARLEKIQRDIVHILGSTQTKVLVCKSNVTGNGNTVIYIFTYISYCEIKWCIVFIVLFVFL